MQLRGILISLFLIICLGCGPTPTADTTDDTFIVNLSGIDGALDDSIIDNQSGIERALDDSIEIPNGRPIYAFLVSGYHENEKFDTFHFYNFAKCVLEKGGYVHYSWWNNMLAPYMEKPLHDTSSEPGNIADGDLLGFLPILDILGDKAIPAEDYQFQSDLEEVLTAIRENNPDAVIVLVGHSMGGDAVARFGANTNLDIDLLAPIDPVGNRNCTQWAPDLDIYQCTGLIQWTRFRATHDDWFWFPARRSFGSNIKFLYHRWQQEFVPPMDYTCPPGGNVLPCLSGYGESDYLFDFDPLRTRAFGIGQGSTNVQSKMPTSLFSGCDLDPRWWVCPDWSGGLDGHGEIIGWRGIAHSEHKSALEARGDWPHRYYQKQNPEDPDPADLRKSHLENWEADPNYLKDNSYAPTNPQFCKVSGDLCTILATIMDQAPPVNQPPVADANGPYGSECEGTTTTVSLDGSGSSDPEGTNLAYSWFTNCPGVSPDDPTSSFNDSTSATPELTVDTSNGCTVDCIVELTVTDDLGKEDIATASVTIGDTVSPDISSVSASPEILWPPNHQMRLITVEAVAVDNCDPEPVCKIISVKSNEPTNGKGDGNTAPDWEITSDLKVKLRAERAGGGSGREYTITVECTDDCENSVTEDTTVTVPHDQQ